MPTALITGITGQDGQFLAEFLHEQGLRGLRPGQGPEQPQGRDAQPTSCPSSSSSPATSQDLPSLVEALEVAQPDEVYNLGAISFVAMSFNQAELTANVTGLGVLRMLEAIRIVGGTSDNPIRFYQASSSEMFGKVRETPQTEATPFHPRSPYGCAKVFGHDIIGQLPRELRHVRLLRHPVQPRESERRGLEFVTRKITNAVARIKLGLQDELVARRPRTQARLGLRRRLRQGDVADAAAGRARRLRRRHRRDAQRRGVRRSARSPTPASTTGSATSARTSASSGRPRSTCSSATPPRPGRCSAGSPRSPSTSSSQDGGSRSSTRCAICAPPDSVARVGCADYGRCQPRVISA